MKFVDSIDKAIISNLSDNFLNLDKAFHTNVEIFKNKNLKEKSCFRKKD